MRSRFSDASRPLVLAMIAASLASCGGGSTPTSPPAGGGTRTDTFTGTSSVNTGGGCTGPGHGFTTAGTGTVTIQVSQADLPNVGIQICHPGAQNHALECTVPPWTPIAAGGTLSAAIRGARAQTITIVPAGCDTTTVTAATLNYAVNVTYPF